MSIPKRKPKVRGKVAKPKLKKPLIVGIAAGSIVLVCIVAAVIIMTSPLTLSEIALNVEDLPSGWVNDEYLSWTVESEEYYIPAYCYGTKEVENAFRRHFISGEREITHVVIRLSSVKGADEDFDNLCQVIQNPVSIPTIGDESFCNKAGIAYETCFRKSNFLVLTEFRNVEEVFSLQYLVEILRKVEGRI